MKDDKAKSVKKLVANKARERKLSRDDAFTAYGMDRLLFRLGRSRHSKEFLLKGGVLIASWLGMSHRFTRDIDVLRRRGSANPDRLRQMFRNVVRIDVEDGLTFREDGVTATIAKRADDGYDGVHVTIRGSVGSQELSVEIDIGFGDAVVPPPDARVTLPPFLDGDQPAYVWAYGVEPVLSEKIEALVSKFPLIQHRLKDILDVITLSKRCSFEGSELITSMEATFVRRETPPDVRVLDNMRTDLKGRKWETPWAEMLRDKAVLNPPTLREAVEQFDVFARPLLLALQEGGSPGRWEPGGPWQAPS